MKIKKLTICGKTRKVTVLTYPKNAEFVPRIEQEGAFNQKYPTKSFLRISSLTQ